MQKISFGFMNPETGHLLRVYSTEHDEDCITPYREFTLDKSDEVYETEEAAAVLDIMNRGRASRCISGEARSDWLPRPCRWLVKRDFRIDDYVPVAFVRELEPILEGGDELVTSMNVRLVRFDDAADPESIWFDDIENRFRAQDRPRTP